MKPLLLLLALYLTAAVLVHFGQPDMTDDAMMSVQDEIRQEMLTDMAAARMGDIWLEPPAAAGS